jgi:hypothetical protein
MTAGTPALLEPPGPLVEIRFSLEARFLAPPKSLRSHRRQCLAAALGPCLKERSYLVEFSLSAVCRKSLLCLR